MSSENPLNPLPPVVIAIAVGMITVEAALEMSASGLIGGRQGIGWRIAALEQYAFAPAVSELLFERGIWSLDLLKRFVTYPFVHGGFTHAAFGVVLLLALGKYVGEIIGSLAVLLIFILASIFGALVYGAVTVENVPLYGAYPPAYGMIGAFTYLTWLRARHMGQSQLAAFRLIGILLGLQLAYSILFGSNPQWRADVAGFVAGFALAPLLAPGGWMALLMRLRQR